MDNDKAIAGAIAALEEAREWITDFDEAPTVIVGSINTALASLRAIAPAPADPSEIDGWRTSLNYAEDARDAVVADKNELFGLLEGLYFRIMGRDGIFEPKKAIDEIIDRWDYVGHALKLADDNAARNAPADQSDAARAWLIHYEDADKPSEIFTSEGAKEIALKRYNQAHDGGWNCVLFKSVAGPTRLDPIATDLRAADQSDAGRDGAIEECAMVAERQYISSISFDANPYRDVAAAIRALASAPTTVPPTARLKPRKSP